MLAAGFEGGWRALRRVAPGSLSRRLENILELAIGITGAGGLGLIVGGGRPAEALHFVYGILAFGIVPLTNSLTRRASPRAQGLWTVVAALVVLVVIARLFQTG